MGLDSAYGIGSLKPGVCTSTTKPAVPFDGQVIYMTDVDQTAVWDGTQWVGTSPLSGRNVIINGGFDVWQRGTSVAGLNNTPSYGADRWVMFRSSSTNHTMSRQSITPSELSGFNWCARYQRDSGDTSAANMYFIATFESTNIKPLAAKTVVLSFYARKGANYSGGNLNLNIDFGTGTDTAALTQPTSPTTTTAAYTLTSSWQRFSQSVSVASTATAARAYWDYVPSGTAGTNDYFEITGVQLEAGSVPTPFEFETYGENLQKCKRYYYRAVDPVGVGVSNSNPVRITIPFHTQMRVVPTSTQSGNMNFYNGAGTTVSGSIQAAYNTVHHGQIDFTGPFGSNGQAVVLYSTTGSQYVDFSSELN